MLIQVKYVQYIGKDTVLLNTEKNYCKHINISGTQVPVVPVALTYVVAATVVSTAFESIYELVV